MPITTDSTTSPMKMNGPDGQSSVPGKIGGKFQSRIRYLLAASSVGKIGVHFGLSSNQNFVFSTLAGAISNEPRMRIFPPEYRHGKRGWDQEP
jgi:hypothetical protein